MRTWSQKSTAQRARLPRCSMVRLFHRHTLFEAYIVIADADELNFQNPTSLTGNLSIEQPAMLEATLKEYQLKGLNWLGNLYEQGINGILADEMGLGKVSLRCSSLLHQSDLHQTVQSISLLAYLAEKHDIWGPFLVVAPASTLFNWQQEVSRFVPKMKTLPYWGTLKDRATLRKFWTKKDIIFNKDAPFHVLITSYQLVCRPVVTEGAMLTCLLDHARCGPFPWREVAVHDS